MIARDRHGTQRMSAVIRTTQADAGHDRTLALVSGAATRGIVFDRHGAVDAATFQAQVRGLAATLPQARYAINLCEDRSRFLVALCAVALRGQITLLPPSRAAIVIDEVRAQHADSYCIGDGAQLPEPCLRVPEVLPQCDGAMPSVDPSAVAVIGFTSGSTGVPKPNPKSWAGFAASTAQNVAALRDLWPADALPQIVATVPPQHMYGMELSILLPLLGDAAVHRARPFFPEDVAAALHEASAHRLLVTTPVHLRALLESGIALPPLAGIVTATAPLSQALADFAETRFACEVRELFGSTETCVIARRRTARDRYWTPLSGVSLSPQPDGTLVRGPHLAAPVVLADLVEVQGDGRFRLCGRQSDLLEIAGKRASLAELTRRLLAIPGVVDGVVFQLDEADSSAGAGAGNGVRRIAALVVAPTLDAAAIQAALHSSVDPVFLPRRLRCVAALPRNDTGKLPHSALLALLQGDVQSAPDCVK